MSVTETLTPLPIVNPLTVTSRLVATRHFSARVFPTRILTASKERAEFTRSA